MTSQEYVNKITLEYLGSNHQVEPHSDQLIIESELVNFYKKRLYAGIKHHINMLTKPQDGSVKTNTDCILTEYIDKKINEFRIDDFADLQKKDLSDNNLVNSEHDTNTSNLKDPNVLLYNQPNVSPTLDDFVIKKTISTAYGANYPKEKNLMNKNFRYKGVKKRE